MEERHSRVVGSERHIWNTARLWKLAEQLESFDLPIEQVSELDMNCWFERREPTLREISTHAIRIEKANLSFPIILDEEGSLMDGGHRLCKALVQGHTTISAVQFRVTPEPDERVPVDA